MKNTIYTISGASCIQEEIINVRYWKIISIWMSKIGLSILYAMCRMCRSLQTQRGASAHSWGLDAYKQHSMCMQEGRRFFCIRQAFFSFILLWHPHIFSARFPNIAWGRFLTVIKVLSPLDQTKAYFCQKCCRDNTTLIPFLLCDNCPAVKNDLPA